MAAQTLPRLPKLQKLSKLQALLLLGGAFVFAVLVRTAYTHKIVVDRTPAVPEQALLAATIFDRSSEDWLAFESKLPEGARQALSQAGDLRSVTLFAVPGEGAVSQWGLLEALSVRTERSGWKRLRLVRKDISAVGQFVFGDRVVPFEASVARGRVQARVGVDYRGPSFEARPYAKKRRMHAPMQGQTAYLEKPDGVAWIGVIDLLGTQLQRFQSQANLWNLPGRLEMAVAATNTEDLSPFVLFYRPEHGKDLAGPALETYAKGLLAESDPTTFKVALPDDTNMQEFRHDPDSILTERKTVGQVGERAKLQRAGSDRSLEIFYANDGEAWMSTDIGLIQAAVFSNIEVKPTNDACEAGGRDGFAAFSGKNLKYWPIFMGMDRLTVSIHNMESGMFTTCGYFTP